jgi:uncharacterized membrane protein YoaK (UPF0700 family)
MTQTEHTRNEISQLDARAKRKFSFLLALLIVGAILSLFLASLFGRLDISVAEVVVSAGSACPCWSVWPWQWLERFFRGY